MRIFRVNSLIAVAALVATSLFGSGCSTGHGKMQKEVESLRSELTALQGDYDRVTERLMAVEQRQPPTHAARGPVAARPGAVDRPPLKIVRLSNRDAAAAAAESTEHAGPAPSETADAGDPASADEGERVRIVARGDKIYTTTVPASAKQVAKTAKPSKQ